MLTSSMDTLETNDSDLVSLLWLAAGTVQHMTTQDERLTNRKKSNAKS